MIALTSCMKIEIVNMMPDQVDTIMVQRSKPHKPLPPRDTTEVNDTARVEIGFNPSVGGWKDEEQDVNL